MPVTKPATLPRWADTVTADPDRYLAPVAGKLDVGFQIEERPPAQYMNWLFFWIYKWAQWLNDIENQAITWTAAHVFGKGISATGDGAGAGVIGVGGATGGGNAFGGDFAPGHVDATGLRASSHGNPAGSGHALKATAYGAGVSVYADQAPGATGNAMVVRGATGALAAVDVASNDHIGIQITTNATRVGGINISSWGGAGAPSSGTAVKNDLAVDSGAVLYICTVSGAPGTWAKVGAQ